VGNKSVSRKKVRVQIIQGKRVLIEVNFIYCQLAGDHHGDFRDFNGERDDIQAIEVLNAEIAEAWS